MEEAVTESAEVVAPVAWRLRSVVRPVFEILNSVEVAPEEDVDAITNSVVLSEVEAAWMERLA